MEAVRLRRRAQRDLEVHHRVAELLSFEGQLPQSGHCRRRARAQREGRFKGRFGFLMSTELEVDLPETHQGREVVGLERPRTLIEACGLLEIALQTGHVGEQVNPSKVLRREEVGVEIAGLCYLEQLIGVVELTRAVF